MKSLIKRLYNALTAPLYRRLLLDISIKAQEAHLANLDYQEKIAAKLLDELVCVRLEIERAVKESKQAGTGVVIQDNGYADVEKPVDKFSDEEVHKIVNQISSHVKIVELACDTQIPMSQIFDWRSKYSGLTLGAVRKMRRIEKENMYLKQKLLNLQFEREMKSDSEIFSS